MDLEIKNKLDIFTQSGLLGISLHITCIIILVSIMDCIKLVQ